MLSIDFTIYFNGLKKQLLLHKNSNTRILSKRAIFISLAKEQIRQCSCDMEYCRLWGFYTWFLIVGFMIVRCVLKSTWHADTIDGRFHRLKHLKKYVNTPPIPLSTCCPCTIPILPSMTIDHNQLPIITILHPLIKLIKHIKLLTLTSLPLHHLNLKISLIKLYRNAKTHYRGTERSGIDQP